MSTVRANTFLDGAGGNTATINGITPALASQAEAEAGTDNTKLMTPLRVEQAINAANWPYVSSNQAYVAATTITLAHGLGRVPIEVMAVAKCITAQSPYVVGDEVIIGYVDGNTVGSVVTVDATNIVFRMASNGLRFLTNAGALLTPTAANWNIIVRAR